MNLSAHIEETAQIMLYGSLLCYLLRRFTFEELQTGVSVESVAIICGVSKSDVEGLLLITCKHGLLEFDGKSCKLIKLNNLEAFRLLKYLGAYGTCLVNPFESMRGKNIPSMSLLAQAYKEISSPRLTVCVEVILQLPVMSIAELGCGSAPILRTLALHQPSIQGWAIDPSADMVNLARQCIARDGVSERIRVLQGSIEDVCDRSVLLPSQPEAICLRSVLNSYFAHPDSCKNLLKHLADSFPRAYVVICDYYSADATHNDGLQATQTHNIIQILSGQGLPPVDEKEWQAIYEFAGYDRFSHTTDNSVPGIKQFVDVLVLRDQD